MIDRTTGSITLSATCQLKAGDTFSELLALQLGESQEVADRNNGWKWLTIKNLEVAGDYVIISLCFYADALKQIELIVSENRFDLSDDWHSWSERNELVILKKLRTWLRNELGREGKFDWGEVWASYDPKGGSSSISLRYA
ncbi:hypothetical protein GCM10028818_39810 [Spirosoma horti]